LSLCVGEMDLLAGYGSDGDGSGSEDGNAAAAPKQVATGGLLGSLPAAKDAVGGGAGGGLLGDLPPAKKQRRTFELPIKKLAPKPADSDEDDDETPAPVPKSTKSGFLSFVSPLLLLLSILPRALISTLNPLNPSSSLIEPALFLPPSIHPSIHPCIPLFVTWHS
jgi:hypothetical protein